MKGRVAWNKGIPRTEEERRKMSESLKGRPKAPRSEETKRKISETLKRRFKEKEA